VTGRKKRGFVYFGPLQMSSAWQWGIAGMKASRLCLFWRGGEILLVDCVGGVAQTG